MRRTISLSKWLNACVCSMLFTVAPGVAVAQHEGHSAETKQLPVVVDGKKNPELISDDLAWNHFLMVVSEHRNASAEDIRRRQARIAALGLGDSDAASFVQALSGLKEEIDDIDSTRIRNGGSEGLQSRWNNAMANARRRVREALSIDGQMRLDAFIRQRVKPGIVIYGSN